MIYYGEEILTHFRGELSPIARMHYRVVAIALLSYFNNLFCSYISYLSFSFRTMSRKPLWLMGFLRYYFTHTVHTLCHEKIFD